MRIRMKMKTKITSICALALLITACSNDNDPINGGQGGAEKNEIKLGTSVMTRASVESEGEGFLTKPGSIDIAFLRAPDSEIVELPDVWKDAVVGTQATPGFTTGTVTATLTRVSGQNRNLLEFDEPQYYNNDVAKYSHLKGYYPTNNVTFEKSTTVEATWTINGSTDVMVSDYFRENRGASASPVAVKFQHMLSKITIQVVPESQIAVNYWGAVDKVEIFDVPSQVKHEFDGNVANQYKVDSLANTKANITIKELDSGQTQDGDAPSTMLEVDGAGKGKTKVLGQAMVYPDETYRLKIHTSVGGEYGPVTATIDGGAKPGMNHVITLTFKSGEITASTTVKPWEDGGTGTGTIQ